jgi:ferrochelatase
MQSEKINTGVLIVNLGTPDAPLTPAVRCYLAEFLADPRVVKLPRHLWLSILYGLILPWRAPQSAKLYQKIWMPEGSPLRVFTERLGKKLQKELPEDTHVAVGMRYGSPSIEHALTELQKKNVQRIFVLPLYPQYSSTTTASVFDAVAATLKKWSVVPELHFITQYAENPAYIAALVSRIQQHWAEHGASEQLLFSFHGIPERLVNEGDPYAKQCHQTADAVANALNLPRTAWQIVFQSRFGRAKWLAPDCVEVLKKLPATGVKKVDIICPGFAVDCLETLEEIAIRNRAIFMAAGGEKFNYIPALNDDPSQIELLARLVNT